MFNFGSKKKVLIVEGMTCHHCEMTVEKALLEIPGIKTAKADHAARSVAIEYKEEPDFRVMKEKIEKVGYRLAE